MTSSKKHSNHDGSKMKKLIIFALAVAALAASYAQKAVLKGEMIGFGEKTKMVVCQGVNNKLVPIDTVEIGAKGRYKVSLPATPTGLYILTFTREKSPMLHVMLLPDETVTLNAEYVQTQNFAKVTEAKGSKNMELYKQFNNVLTDPQAPQLIYSLLDANADCLMSAFLVTYFDQQFEAFYPLYEKIRDRLVGEYPADPSVQYINHRVSTTLLPGKMAPEIAMKDPDGKERKLSDLRGKVVMIDFWASWCRPCRAENPNVVRLYKKYKDKGFEIYSVSMDKSKNQWLQAIKADGLEWANHVSDLNGWTSSGGATYGITSIPATVLIDKEGKVIARNLRGAELADKLREIFGE